MRELDTGPRVKCDINPKAGLCVYSNGVCIYTIYTPCYTTTGTAQGDALSGFLVRDQGVKIIKARKLFAWL